MDVDRLSEPTKAFLVAVARGEKSLTDVQSTALTEELNKLGLTNTRPVMGVEVAFGLNDRGREAAQALGA